MKKELRIVLNPLIIVAILCLIGGVFPRVAFGASNSNLKWLADIQQDSGIEGIDYSNTPDNMGDNIKETEGISLNSTDVDKSKAASAISLNKTELSLVIGESEVLIPSITGGTDADKQVSWSSSKESVVTVDRDGKVVAKGKGEAVITVTTVTNPPKKAECIVEVTEAVAQNITLDQSQLTLRVGENGKLTSVISPEFLGDPIVSWNVKDSKIATVDKDGNVTAIAKGITIVTASLTDGSVAECKVIVNHVTNNNLSIDVAVEMATDDAKGNGTVTIPAIPKDIVSSSKQVAIALTMPTSDILRLMNNTISNTITITMIISKQIVDTANLELSNIKLEKGVLDQIKAKNKILVVSVKEETSSDVLYTWTFAAANITKSLDVDLFVKVVDTTAVPAIKNLLTRTTGTAVVQFAHNGNLPGKNQIRIGIKDKGFVTGNSLYLYFYNSEKNRLENGISGYRVDSNGYVQLTINHCSQYLLTKTRLSSGSSSGGGSSGGGSSGGGSGGTGVNIGSSQPKNGYWIYNTTGWWYRNNDGSFTTNGWQFINGFWYLFNKDGYMLTGWQLVNGIWYYLQPGGNMISNDWFFYNNQWYYFRLNGSMNMGWVLWKGLWYYNGSPNGGMIATARTPDGYWVGADGVWIP